MDDTTPKFLESVTEHPDVQRLIKQVIRGDYMVKELRAENAQLKRALGHPEPDNSNKQYMFCGYCGKEGAMTIDELQQHILSCEHHPIAKLQSENKRLKEEIIKPLLEGYCNMAGMLQTDFQFMGDQLTQKAEQALEGE